ncbi:MAG: hypothetical protein ACRC2H_12800, partial [Silanimonas sp.]
MRLARLLPSASTPLAAGLVALALVACFGAVPSVQAGTLYRCVGPDGRSHYGSRRQSGMTCTVAATYRPDPRPAIAPKPAPPPTEASAGASSAATDSTVAAAAPASGSPRRVEFLARPGAAPAPAPVAASARGARVTRGAVYTYTKDGVTHYTNVRPQNA